MLKGVDSDSASELEFNSEAEEGGEGEGVVTANEVRYLSWTNNYCIIHDYLFSIFPQGIMGDHGWGVACSHDI